MTSAICEQLRRTELVQRQGRIIRVVGQAVESEGPISRLGEICEIRAARHGAASLAEVIGFSDRRVLLMPYGDLRGCQVGSEVRATGMEAIARVGRGLLGRIVDAFGSALDSKGLLQTDAIRPLYPAPINPLARGPVEDVLPTGIRVVDTMLPIGRGQRIGIFAGSGVGKSTLLGMLAREIEADVMVVALVGERGREVQSFADRLSKSAARERSIVIAATSDQPPLVRARAAFYATAVAEYFREQGLHVALLMDSITRVATAQREMGLAVGELPTARGFTPSVFAMLPRLLERGGVRAAGGSLTGLYTVLVDGDDMNDPIADAVRAILDGHVVLSRDLAHRGCYPAVDVLKSVSRLAPALSSIEQKKMRDSCIKWLSTYESARDLIEVGAYRAGTNADTDRSIALQPRLTQFFGQSEEESCPAWDSWSRLQQLLNEGKP